MPILLAILCCTKIRRIKNKQDVKLQQLSEEHASNLKNIKEKNDTAIERLQEDNKHNIQVLALNKFSQLQAGMDASIALEGDMIKIQVKPKTTNTQNRNVDETDGGLVLSRHSKQSLMFQRVRSVDEPITENSIDEEEADTHLSMQCVKCLVEATFVDPILGPQLDSFMSDMTRFKRSDRSLN